MHTFTMMCTNDVFRGESSTMTQLPKRVSCLLHESRIYLDPTILPICTASNKIMQDDNGLNMNERVLHVNGIMHDIKRSCILTLECWMEDSHMMEDSLASRSFSDGIQLNRPKGVEWLNKIFRRHISNLESDLLETGPFNFGQPPRPFFSSQTGGNGFGERIDSRDSLASNRSKQPDSTALKKETKESSTSQR